MNDYDGYEKVYKAEKGLFYDAKHYNRIINEDAIGYKEDGSILFMFKKGVIPKEKRKYFLDIMRSAGKTKSKNRGSGGGYIDINKFPKAAKEFCTGKGNPLKSEKIFGCYYKNASGVVVNRNQGNQVRCGVAGYFDDTAGLGCRKVRWSATQPERHKKLEEFCMIVGNHMKEVAPETYDYQKSKTLPDWVFKDSIFSTLTINYDFRTACHKDAGDLEGSLSTLTILEEEEDNYMGFYTGLPEYKIMFDIRSGDTLIFDAHEYHCNTEYIVKSDKLKIDDMTGNNFAGRLAVVAYLRNGINLCGNEE